MPAIDDVFQATPQSAWDFLCTNGQGCYIPPYQRPYAWTQEEIERLFEDVTHSVHQMERQTETISFLGAIIALIDISHKTVLPTDRANVAPRVMVIIDGQQRLATIVMSNIALHNRIKRDLVKLDKLLKKDDGNIAYDWLADECANLLPLLRNTYLIDRNTGNGNYRYYPRIIRAYQDKWSRRETVAIYQSPVAELIWEYIMFSEGDENAWQEGEDFKPTIDDSIVKNAFAYIKKYIDKRVCMPVRGARSEDLLSRVKRAKNIPSSFWDSEPKEEIFESIQEDMEGLGIFCNLLQLVSFTRYINHRVAITAVTAKNEDDAFDMFDALNTTGQLLTAFETFRPAVIRREGLEEYQKSDSAREIAKVEKYIGGFEKDKEKRTAEMLVAFALAETGTKLREKLNLQRQYLRTEYDRFEGSPNRGLEFLHSMAGTALFLENWWGISADKTLFKPLHVTDEEALVAFRALCAIRHTITVAPLSRFYQSALDSLRTKENSSEKVSAFVDAIKATAAFAFLWRGAKAGQEVSTSTIAAL